MYSLRMVLPLKGRGALSNPDGRFRQFTVASVEDGWFEEEPPASIATSVEPDRARTVINTNDSPDIPFDYSINPYRGCEHGCIYCYARPSHAYLGLSPGLDFETRLLYKADAARLLADELARPGYACKPITLGANTDPYQPVEKRLRVTRSILEVLHRCKHPVSIVTKGTLILRDLDLLGEMARERLASVAVSITSLDADIKRTLEPRAAAPSARIGVVRALAGAGVPTCVLVAPVIPALTDNELEAILRAAAQAGATGAGYVLLRLPHEVSGLFRQWLAAHYPERAHHVMSLLHDLRGGRDNDSRFGSRMRGTGPYADLLRARFQAACRRLRIESGCGWQLETALFRPPGSRQLELGL
jgi:DNA repair photolyase